jgi:PAS domain S-box-containing protein
VFRTGEPLLATPEVFAEMEKAGEVESIGAPSIDWLGVPLQVEDQTFGVLVVQSYTEGVRYGREERDILRFVSGQAAMAITRRRTASDIQEREQFLSGVLDSIQDGISILDKDFTIVRVNRTMEQWYAHALPLVGKKCYQAYHLRNEPCSICPTQQTIETSQASYKVVRLVGAGGGVTGWLDLYSFPFIDQKTGQMKGVIEYVRDITQRKQAEDRLQSSLREKEVLLREVHHRVKNNLQVIQSLISLQTRRIKDEQAVEMCKESQRRIRAMALVHERLYQSTDLSRIEFADYLRSLIIHLFHSMLSDTNRIALTMDLEPVQLNINTAIPCGLIVNELVSNALKHAFPGEKSGSITVSIHKAEDGEYRLGVTDNGIGLPPEFEIHESETMGMQIVGTLVSQLGGRLAIGRNGGADFQINFREAKDQLRAENNG